MVKDVNEHIDEIDGKYRAQQKLHELDFLDAYSGQMRFVMEEVNELKKQLTDKELKIKRDQKVADLT